MRTCAAVSFCRGLRQAEENSTISNYVFSRCHASPVPDQRVFAKFNYRVDGKYFPSPADWRDEIIYFLLPDRFSDGKRRTALCWIAPTSRRGASADF